MLSEKSQRVATETRKSTKSAMEKKRRARINDSLKELKDILAEIITYKGERFDKMEKADILEMTVQYVKNTSKGKAKNHLDDEEYTSGVNSCLGEVIKYIASNNDCDTHVKTQILDHLANRITGCSREEAGGKTPKTAPVSQPVVIRNSHPPVMSTATSALSDIDADTNNNSQEAHNFNRVRDAKCISPTELQSSQSSVVEGSAQLVPVIQPMAQQSSVIQPLTLIVPANMYPAGVGTTCLVPVAMSGSPNISHQLVNTGSPTFNTNTEISQIVTNGPNIQGIQLNQIVQPSNLVSGNQSVASRVSPVQGQTSPNLSAVTFSTIPSQLSTPQLNVSPSGAIGSATTQMVPFQVRSIPEKPKVALSTIQPPFSDTPSIVLSSNIVGFDSTRVQTSLDTPKLTFSTNQTLLTCSQPSFMPADLLTGNHKNTACKIIKPIPINERKCPDAQVINHTPVSENDAMDSLETQNKYFNRKCMCFDSDVGTERLRQDNVSQIEPSLPSVSQFHQIRETETRSFSNRHIYSQNCIMAEKPEHSNVTQSEPPLQNVSQYLPDTYRQGNRPQTTVDYQEKTQCLWRPF